MINDSAQAIEARPIEISVPELAGVNVEGLRVCQADGVELLFELRDNRGAAKRDGRIAPTDLLTIPASCGPHGSNTLFVYAGNDHAWPVREFLKTVGTTSGLLPTSEWRISVGKMETISLHSEEFTHSNSAPNEVTVCVRNFQERALSPALLRVNLGPALAWLPTASLNSLVSVRSARDMPVLFFRIGEGNEVLLSMDMPARSERLLYVRFENGKQSENSLLADYGKLLNSGANLAANGSFEAGEDAPTSWQQPRIDGTTQVTAGFSGDCRFGRRSLELSVSGNPSGWVGWHSLEIPVRPGATYLLGGWLKAVGLTGSAAINAHFHNANGALTQSGSMVNTQPQTSGDSDWVNSVAFIQAPPDSATVQIHLTFNAAGTLRHDGVILAEVLEAEVSGIVSEAADRSPQGLRVWQVNPLRKVFPGTPPQPQPSNLEVELARNEHEAFQIALRGPSKTAVRDLTVSLSPLSDTNGVQLPAPIVERVGFVPIDYPSSYYRSEAPEWCRQVPRGAGATDGWAGWWPDPLLPNAPFDLAKDQTQPVWITMRTPRDALPGVYRGSVEIRGIDVETVSLPLVVRVLPFLIPDQAKLRGLFYLRFGPGGTFGPDPNDKGERRRWLRFMAEHRLAIDFIQPPPKFSYKDGRVSMDAADFDEEARYCFNELGMGVAFVPNFFSMFGWAYQPKKLFGLEPLTSEWISAFKQSYSLFADHVREKGWEDKFVYYISDEPHFQHPHVVEQMKKLCALIHEVNATIPIYSSTWRHVPDWDDSLDLWGVGQYGCFPVQEMERLQKAGKQMWFTIDGQMATDTPLLATERLLSYYCFKYGVKGFEFWGLNWWTYDPWTTGWHQFIRQSDEGKKYYSVRYPDGDGFLAYPGKPVGVEGPISSIRLEQVREGLEDYEAMVLLDHLVQTAQRAGLSKAAGETALAQAKALVAIPNAGGLRSTEILPNPERLLDARRAINAAIVQLQTTVSTHQP